MNSLNRTPPPHPLKKEQLFTSCVYSLKGPLQITFKDRERETGKWREDVTLKNEVNNLNTLIDPEDVHVSKAAFLNNFTAL